MLKKFVLLAVALTLAAPAFADEPSKSPASKNVSGSTKPAKNQKGHRSELSDGTEVHAVRYGVQSPYVSNGKLSGKRHHDPAPPANGSLDKKIPTGFDTATNAPPK
jgi:hypothetical protein